MNGNSPLVSIIMPAYNAERHIAVSLESALAQTMDDFELIVVNPGSTDRTSVILEQFAKKDPRIKLVNLPSRLWAGEARNEGIKLASGRYIAFLDSDDSWLSTKLERQIAFMEEKKANFSYGPYRVIYENGKETSFAPPEKLTHKKLLHSNYIGTLTVVYDTASLGKRLFPATKLCEDYACWLEILRDSRCSALSVGQCLASYRVGSSSLSSHKLETLKFLFSMYRKQEKMGVLKSCFYVVSVIFNKVFLKY